MDTRKLAVLMFTDMVGYSRKVHSDEEHTLAQLTEYNYGLSTSYISTTEKAANFEGDYSRAIELPRQYFRDHARQTIADIRGG